MDMSFQVAKNFLLALASTVLLALVAALVPLGGMLLIPLVPQPALAFGLRYGPVRATALLALATALVAYLGGPELAAGYALLALMAALLLFSFGRGWPIERVVAGATAGMLGALAAGLSLFYGPVSAVRDGLAALLTANMDASLDLYGKFGLSPESLDLLRERAPDIVDTVLTVLPALAFAAFAVVVLINLFFLLRRFPERRAYFAAPADLKEWRSPEFLVWCLILSGFALFLPDAAAARTPALNIFLMIVVFYFFQGLSIIAYYFHHKHVPHFFRSLIYVAIVFEQICTVFVVALGLFDMWGDFRRLKKKDLSPVSGA